MPLFLGILGIAVFIASIFYLFYRTLDFIFEGWPSYVPAIILWSFLNRLPDTVISPHVDFLFWRMIPSFRWLMHVGLMNSIIYLALLALVFLGTLFTIKKSPQLVPYYFVMMFLRLIFNPRDFDQPANFLNDILVSAITIGCVVLFVVGILLILLLMYVLIPRKWKDKIWAFWYNLGYRYREWKRKRFKKN
ncbi:hypothetical protein [Aerococcus mictus]|uniref:hypothetical protein n=1 Tax=Aerococcus mictus TaxID=2976810 RepID=UPI0018A72555|nr:hypothetical protein [Aerococcus mictus]MCY3067581.1 hypothetical protein [Aerococcus mictus]MCY3080884.1 hypothetical protein [Aerococcus mictus]